MVQDPRRAPSLSPRKAVNLWVGNVLIVTPWPGGMSPWGARSDVRILQYAEPALLADAAFALQVMDVDGLGLEFLAPALQANPEARLPWRGSI